MAEQPVVGFVGVGLMGWGMAKNAVEKGFALRVVQELALTARQGDQLVPVDSSRWLASQIPQSHLHLVNGAGHVPTVTHASEIAEAINQYFATVL